MSTPGNCEAFEPQRFRPNFCKNCLKLKSEHAAISAPSSQTVTSPAPVKQETSSPRTVEVNNNNNNNQSNNNNAEITNNNSNNSSNVQLRRPVQHRKELPQVPTSVSPLSLSSPPAVSPKRASTPTAIHSKGVVRSQQRASRGIRASYIQAQQQKGEIPNAQKFLQQQLLRNLLIEGIRLSANDAEDIIRRTQGCLKANPKDKTPVILLDKKGREFLKNHIQQIETFLGEQDDMMNIIRTQSLVRRFLVLKKFKGLDKDAISKLKRRNDSYMDLIRSEKQYLNTIDKLIEHYVLPLRHSDLIAPYECASIFSNLESIAEVHKDFMKRLQSLDNNFPFVSGIGKIFLDLSTMLKAYSVFVSNFKNAINEVERLQSENQKFAIFLADKAANWIDLTTLLSMPLNRMTQYEHLLKSLNENLIEGTEDFEECVKAISVLSQSSAAIEMNLVQSADTAKILSCQRKLRADGPLALNKPGRKLLCELKTRKNAIFIFTDILIVAKPQGKGKSHRESHRGGIKTKEEIMKVTIHCSIQDVELIDIDSKNLELKVKGDSHTEKVPFGTPDEKTKWIRLYQSILEDKNRVKVFGVPLGDTVVREERSNGIPTIVEKTIAYITQQHLSHPGIFRVAGSKAEIDKLRSIFDFGGEEVRQLDLGAYGAFSVCDVLKLFFRCLPEPLLGYSLYKPIVELMRNDELSTEEKVVSMKDLVLMWTPPFAVKVLKYLLKFLHNVSSFEEVNKMSASNLSIVFGPTLLWSETNTLESAMDMPYINSFVCALIENNEIIFGK